MNKRLLKVIVLIVIFFCFCSNVFADAKTNEVRIYFFHSKDCSHCKKEEVLLNKIEKNYDNVRIFRYEIHDDVSINILAHVRDVYHIEGNGVPITIIGEKLFMGYLEEKSVISFVRAVEYYSRYSYRDRVMGNVEVASVYQNYENIPSYQDFTQDFIHYSIMGISSDEIDVDVCAILIGFLSQIHVLFFASIIIVLLFLRVIGGDRAKIFLLVFYFFSLFLFRVSEVVHHDYFSLGVGIFFFITFMINFVLYLKNKRRNYLVMNIFIILVLLIQCFYSNFSGKYFVMLKNISSFHLLDGMDLYLYYGNYFFSIFIFNLLFIIGFYLFFQKKLRR